MAGAGGSVFVRSAWVVSSVLKCESLAGSTLQYGGTIRISTSLGTDPGTPAVLVNDQLIRGAPTLAELDSLIALALSRR